MIEWQLKFMDALRDMPKNAPVRCGRWSDSAGHLVHDWDALVKHNADLEAENARLRSALDALDRVVDGLAP